MRLDGLTPQQYRVAHGVASGKTDKEIAAELYVKRSAVSEAIRRICKKWQITSGNVRVKIANRVNRTDQAA